MLVVAHPRTDSRTTQVAHQAAHRDEPDRQDRGKVYSAEVRAHMRRIDAADVIVVFPLRWFGPPPAILKGWIDRIWNYGFAYGRSTPRLAATRMLRPGGEQLLGPRLHRTRLGQNPPTRPRHRHLRVLRHHRRHRRLPPRLPHGRHRPDQDRRHHPDHLPHPPQPQHRIQGPKPNTSVTACCQNQPRPTSLSGGT
ncbi:NAD(P)H-dependent oxidoreductase [Streptomyces sp. enrichment culture]|uniref:NAD(P)H-dependent oxidoreductase n=1 Tax=Streptomyces sp. enrichment culture TaxID=1795815 RepID=UPI003F54CD62